MASPSPLISAGPACCVPSPQGPHLSHCFHSPSCVWPAVSGLEQTAFACSPAKRGVSRRGATQPLQPSPADTELHEGASQTSALTPSTLCLVLSSSSLLSPLSFSFPPPSRTCDLVHLSALRSHHLAYRGGPGFAIFVPLTHHRRLSLSFTSPSTADSPILGHRTPLSCLAGRPDEPIHLSPTHILFGANNRRRVSRLLPPTSSGAVVDSCPQAACPPPSKPLSLTEQDVLAGSGLRRLQSAT